MESPLSSKQWKQTPPTTEEIVSQIVQEFAEWLEPEGDKMEIFSLDLNQ
jgi:hypothetical protein